MQQKPKTLYWLLLKGAVQGCGLILLSCIGSMVIGLLMLVLDGRQYGTEFLINEIQQSGHYVMAVANTSQVFELSNWLGHLQCLDINIASFIVSSHEKFLQPVSQALNIVAVSTKLVAVRLFLLWHWLFLFMVLGSIGFIDGTAARAIRKANVGEENASLFHHAAAMVYFSFIMGTIIALLLPFSIQLIEFLIIVFAVLFSVSMRTAVKRYKKFL